MGDKLLHSLFAAKVKRTKHQASKNSDGVGSGVKNISLGKKTLVAVPQNYGLPVS
jgi:hypothetical protein